MINIDGQSDPDRYGAAPAQPIDPSIVSPGSATMVPSDINYNEDSQGYSHYVPGAQTIGEHDLPKQSTETVTDKVMKIMPKGGFTSNPDYMTAVYKAAREKAVELGYPPSDPRSSLIQQALVKGMEPKVGHFINSDKVQTVTAEDGKVINVRNKEVIYDPNAKSRSSQQAPQSSQPAQSFDPNINFDSSLSMSDQPTPSGVPRGTPASHINYDFSPTPDATQGDQGLMGKRQLTNAKFQLAKQIAKQNNTNKEKDRAAKEDKVSSGAYASVSDKIEKGKGRGSVAKAYDAERLANNAIDLLNQYPDLDKMPKNQISVFSDELGKLAKGGASTDKEAQSIMPQSFWGEMADFASKLKNAPEGRGQGKFLAEYRPYLENLRENARAVVGSNIDNIIKGNQRTLSPDDLEQLQAQHEPYLTAYQKQRDRQNKGSVPPTNKSVSTGQGAVPHPQDNAAVTWAKSNLTKDPKRATAILKANGL